MLSTINVCHVYKLLRNKNTKSNNNNNDNNVVVTGHCGATFITKELAFIAFYITRPEHRGKGISRKVFEACMKSFGRINVGLNVRAERQSMYAAGGFGISSFRISGFIGTPKLEEISMMCYSDDVSIVDAGDVGNISLAEYDDSVHIIPRHDFLDKWLGRDGVVCKLAKEGRKIVGYGCIWPAASGYRVMPLYAETKSAALALWRDLCSKPAPGNTFQVVAPSENAEAIQLFTDTLDRVKTPPYDVRMFTKNEVKVNLRSVYSICNYDNNLV